ncbi:MAG: RNA methyltransferase [Actinomycetota bacterium]|nr:RNA methyltransferase [Actinomycetota bacterium]
MPSELISSPANPLLKRIRKLRRRKHREAERALFVEGIAPLWAAAESGAGVEVVVIAPELLTSDRAADLVASLERRETTVARVTGEAFASIADRENPSGLGAIVRVPDRSLQDIVIEETALVVVLHEVGNPGNLGTIVRTADAAGAAGVVVTGASADIWHASSVKASMGTVFATPVVSAQVDEALAWARERDLGVVATSAKGTVHHWDTTYPERCVLLFGSEGSGLPPELLAAADVTVRIPQRGAASSLNLAVAAGILIYEATKYRLGAGRDTEGGARG